MAASGFLLEAFGDQCVGDDDGVCRLGFYHKFQDVEQLAGVASAVAQHGGGLLQFYFSLFQDDVGGDGAVEEFQQVVLLQRLQHVHLAAGEQGADDFERGVLRCGADEGDHALLHGTQQGVLLGLAEAVYLVDEEDGAGL